MTYTSNYKKVQGSGLAIFLKHVLDIGGEISAVAVPATALWIPISLGKVYEQVLHCYTESSLPHFLPEITMTYSVI